MLFVGGSGGNKIEMELQTGGKSLKDQAEVVLVGGTRNGSF